jgi:hypothetical protein
MHSPYSRLLLGLHELGGLYGIHWCLCSRGEQLKIQIGGTVKLNLSPFKRVQSLPTLIVHLAPTPRSSPFPSLPYMTSSARYRHKKEGPTPTHSPTSNSRFYALLTLARGSCGRAYLPLSSRSDRKSDLGFLVPTLLLLIFAPLPLYSFRHVTYG